MKSIQILDSDWLAACNNFVHGFYKYDFRDFAYNGFSWKRKFMGNHVSLLSYDLDQQVKSLFRWCPKNKLFMLSENVW